ncbi:hypothetical protein DFH08DRAFT_824157 [Mycena albidolilacea]|uniref:Uncharacterized protein n=1 Tax=Mycena albidolilacea TaxID=1033008 RepID=A0AAD7EAH9_9AGAR|nr:hypothetical protein DFH08DRAFT_824157 [Mycena albidolilacea]
MQMKPAGFFRDSIRHILLRSSTVFSDGDTYELLGLCPKLVALLIVGSLAKPALLPIFQLMPQIRKWGDCLQDLFGSYRAINLSRPFFRAVFREDDTQMYGELAALPDCTHLCLNGNVAVEALIQILKKGPFLRVLVNFWHVGDTTRAPATLPFADVRFVVLIHRNYWSDWEEGARGEKDFWATADAFVERKRRGDSDRVMLFAGTPDDNSVNALTKLWCGPQSSRVRRNTEAG